MFNLDWLWTLAGFILTLMIFSYIFGDNPIFRLAVYAVVGVTAAYAVLISIDQVLLPRLITPLSQNLTGQPLLLIPLLLCLMLLARIVPRLSGLSGLPLAVLVGVGAAVLAAGAVNGTIIKQFAAVVNDFDFTPARNPFLQLAEGFVLLSGTISTLVFFQFSVRSRAGQPAQRPVFIETLAKIGQVFVAITLGALFAGVFSSALTALIDRLDFLIYAFIRS